MSSRTAKKIVVAGAGPAGLSAAAFLQERGQSVTVLEQDERYVGGIARTVEYKGFRFDIGGHRFFSKSQEITEWWRNRLPQDFIRVKRMSRIFYRGKYFDYPLRAMNALLNLGIFTSTFCVLSYFKARLFPIHPEKSFADWVTNRFGRKLFLIFFKTYTEKVWGMPCEELSADWAAQRIKGLSLLKAILAALFPQKGGGTKIVKTLIDEFEYPRLGPGMMWEKTCADIRAAGGQVQMGSEVIRTLHQNNQVTAFATRDAAGKEHIWPGEFFISTMPLQRCILSFDPPLPASVTEAAKRLQYRDFLTVALMIRRTKMFPDNWIYVHDPSVKLGRIQNFNNWSPELIPSQTEATCLGLEYFCFKSDALWNMDDTDLVALGTSELAKLGLVRPEEVFDGTVVRMEKAYPVYYPGYAQDVLTMRRTLETFPNLQVAGRNGMHKYNNQDHSMMTALLAARNILGEKFDLWRVNTDAEYHEEQTTSAPHSS